MKPSLTLYHISPSRSSVVLWMLEEIAQPYELRIVNAKDGENRAPAYLAINPMGKVPALEHEHAVITETPAICCYLAEMFPEAGLGISIGDRRRGVYLKWLFFSPGALEPAILDRVFDRPAGPRQAMGYGDFETVIDVVAKAVAPGPYLLGDTFTAADVVIGSGLRWGRMTGAVPDRPEIVAYTSRLEQRPAAQRATRKDEEIAAAQSA